MTGTTDLPGPRPPDPRAHRCKHRTERGQAAVDLTNDDAAVRRWIGVRRARPGRAVEDDAASLTALSGTLVAPEPEAGPPCAGGGPAGTRRRSRWYREAPPLNRQACAPRLAAGGARLSPSHRRRRPVFALRERGDPGDAESEGTLELADERPSGEPSTRAPASPPRGRRPGVVRAGQLRRTVAATVVLRAGWSAAPASTNGSQAKTKTMSGPREEGVVCQLAVRNRSRLRTNPAAAARRVSSPCGGHQSDHDLNDRHPDASHHRMRQRATRAG